MGTCLSLMIEWVQFLHITSDLVKVGADECEVHAKRAWAMPATRNPCEYLTCLILSTIGQQWLAELWTHLPLLGEILHGLAHSSTTTRNSAESFVINNSDRNGVKYLWYKKIKCVGQSSISSSHFGHLFLRCCCYYYCTIIFYWFIEVFM